MPHAKGHLSLCATTPEPVLHNKRSHSNAEAHAPQLRVQLPLTATRENPRGSNKDPVQPQISKQINKNYKMGIWGGGLLCYDR